MLLQAIIDLPFAVSPVVVGVALILLWGLRARSASSRTTSGFKIIFGFPGIVLASIFVTVPFVIREVEPVLHELGTDQEEQPDVGLAAGGRRSGGSRCRRSAGA